MTRATAVVVIGLLTGSQLLAQTSSPNTAPAGNGQAGSGSYYGSKGITPAGNQNTTAPNGPQNIQRVAGELPVNNGTAQPRPNATPSQGNVITPPAGQVNPQAGPIMPQRPAAGPAAPGANGNVPGVIPANPGVPFVLGPEEERFVTDVLQQWELKSGAILRFQCDFKKWEYDPAGFGPKDPNTPRMFAKGEIKYETPDKGLFKVKEGKVFSKMNGEKPEYEDQKPENLEQWVCDGKNVFEFDARNKVLRQRQLPPDMQGKAIADGPLPFLFGMKAEKMKARYFIRAVNNPNTNLPNVIWLEAHPKTRGDASNFKMVRIALDKNEFLPQILMLFPPNYDPQRNPSYATYSFENKKSNGNQAVAQIVNLWTGEFYEPKTPFGWKKVVEPFFGEPASDLGAGQAKKLAIPGTTTK